MITCLSSTSSIPIQSSIYPTLLHSDVTLSNHTQEAMGRKNRVTNLLPKSERTHPSSKVTTMSMEPSQPFQRYTHATKRFPRLDDESLWRIFRYAGASTMLRARSVCTQWRRVADDHLRSIRTVDVTRLFPAAPTPYIVRNSMSLFQHVEGITIKNWPFAHVFPCIVEEIAHIDMPLLKEVEIYGVYVTPAVVAGLIKRTSMKSLTIGGDDSVDDSVMKALVSAQSNRRETHSYVLDRLAVRRARQVGCFSVSSLSGMSVAKELIVTSCSNVKNVSFTCESLAADRTANMPEMCSATSCKNLNSVEVKMRMSRNDCSYLNLSQCSMLRSLSFSVNHSLHDEELDLHSDLKELNLSGCRRLQILFLSLTEHGHIRFSNLERLILFGAHALRKSCIYSAFALDKENPLMPKLRRLDLNGTSIDKLVLNGYPELTYVDVSGCPYLNVVEVRSCWKVQSFSILGKRALLSSVYIVLPANCRFEGRRPRWHWSMRHSHQEISYP